jgi:AraC-like DNA-binding protein
MSDSGDPVVRAHLKDARGFSPPIARFGAGTELAGLVRRFWVPIWSLPVGERSVQRVLQYPVCQLVVAPDYAHLVGPRVGMSTKELSGAGWAFGAMLQPAAGALLIGGSMRGLVDRDLELVDVEGLDGARVVNGVRRLLGADPADAAAQTAAAELVQEVLTPLLPLDEEGELVNDVVDHVEQTPELCRVGELADRFAMTERSLQRLCARRVGLSPKWLIQRRRLHEAAGRLADPGRPSLTELSGALGYADQAHFVRDFRAVTGLTPGEYAAEPH